MNLTRIACTLNRETIEKIIKKHCPYATANLAGELLEDVNKNAYVPHGTTLETFNKWAGSINPNEAQNINWDQPADLHESWAYIDFDSKNLIYVRDGLAECMIRRTHYLKNEYENAGPEERLFMETRAKLHEGIQKDETEYIDWNKYEKWEEEYNDAHK